jgi:hypothetical protein
MKKELTPEEKANQRRARFYQKVTHGPMANLSA